jgi:P27 family predicted phage terminase small subunit
MRGRKQTPTETKKRNGNPGKRNLNTVEPSAGKAVTKPKGLDALASELWDGAVDCLDRMGILDRADQIQIEMLCRIYSEWRDCLDTVDREGRICRSMDQLGNEVLKTHPAARQASDASKRLKSILSDFGFNPSSRIQFGNSQKASNPFSDLLNN